MWWGFWAGFVYRVFHDFFYNCFFRHVHCRDYGVD